MANLNCDILLQTEQANGTFRCIGFTGVPAARRSWIALVSTGSADGLASVAKLGEEITLALQAASPEVVTEQIQGPDPPALMDAAGYPNRRKVLVLVAAQGAPFQDVNWYKHWESDDSDASVMTVIPKSSLMEFLPDALKDDRHEKHLLRRTNAKSWSKQISEIIPAVLSRALVTSEVSRIFISYRRVETLTVALQLFDRLTHEGFEVFLDRFTIPPGYDFQRRLNQELEDKSMVVLLESRTVKCSKWTQHEIDFAKRYRLGLVCVRMPDVVLDGDILPSVKERPRLPLAKADFVKANYTQAKKSEPDLTQPYDCNEEGPNPVNEWPRLTAEAEERVVTFLKAEHANALFERRHRLRKDVETALLKQGVNVVAGAVGPLRAGAGNLIWVTTRPPELDDFRNLHGALGQSGGRGAIIGPQAALEPDRRRRLTWLEGRSDCPSFDEANLSDFAVKVSQW